jgi:hypothetical protein
VIQTVDVYGRRKQEWNFKKGKFFNTLSIHKAEAED